MVVIVHTPVLSTSFFDHQRILHPYFRPPAAAAGRVESKAESPDDCQQWCVGIGIIIVWACLSSSPLIAVR